MTLARLVSGLYGMVDTSTAPQLGHLRLAEALIAAGSRVLQLRIKGASDEVVAPIARELARRCDVAGALLILDDRVDLAARIPDVGVHLGQLDELPERARERLGPERVIGWSTHDLAQVARAGGLGVDYIGFGPVFGAASKHLHPDDERTPHEPVGVAGLQAAVEASRLPVVAIGGITELALPRVLATGVDAVAVISAVAGAPEPEAAARRFVDAFVARERVR